MNPMPVEIPVWDELEKDRFGRQIVCCNDSPESIASHFEHMAENIVQEMRFLDVNSPWDEPKLAAIEKIQAKLTQIIDEFEKHPTTNRKVNRLLDDVSRFRTLEEIIESREHTDA